MHAVANKIIINLVLKHSGIKIFWCFNEENEVRDGKLDQEIVSVTIVSVS